MSKQGLSDSLREIPAMLSLLAMVSPNADQLRSGLSPVYFKQRGPELIILLAGGDKRTQAKDIKTALRLARNILE